MREDIMLTSGGTDTSAGTPLHRANPGPWSAIAASVVLLASTFVAAWWLIGDLSSSGFAEWDLDYMLRAPGLADSINPATGMAAVALAAVSGLWLRRSPVLRIPGLLLFGLAVVSALMARVVTAGVIGANIGGGFVILASPFVGVATLGALAAAPIRARNGRARAEETRPEAAA